MFHVLCSMLHVPCSMFYAPCSMLRVPCSILEFSNYHSLLLNMNPLRVFLPLTFNKTPVYEETHPCFDEIFDFHSLFVDRLGSCGLFYHTHHICEVFFIEVVIIISQFAYDWQLKRLSHEKEIVK